MSSMKLPWVLSTLALLVGCGQDNPTNSPVEARLSCGALNRVFNEFGATLRGRSPYVLGAYLSPDGTRLVPGGILGCAGQLALDLEGLCSEYFGRGVCGNPGDFNACLARVEVVFDNGDTCHVCGNGICESFEARLTLNEDHGTWSNVCVEDCSCGNGRCEAHLGENIYSCEPDCPASCGDGLCSQLERCTGCNEPGRPGPPGCQQCEADCCDTACGDGACRPENGETVANCEQDCSLGVCGDGVCLGGENGGNCIDCSGGWSTHCLAAGCTEGGPCVDVRDSCGDGVCTGCEMWTCAVDCQRTGHSVCANPFQDCPAASCGNGQCERPVENAMTCPFDCRWERADEDEPEACDDLVLATMPVKCQGDPDFVRCGDGYCSRAETASDCPDDCVPLESYCIHHQACVGGRTCAQVSVPGPVTGELRTKHAIVTCGDTCEVVEVCAEACVVDGSGPTCVDCGWVNGELENGPGCSDDAAPRCQSAVNISMCIADPANPAMAACSIRRTIPCLDTCSNDTCSTYPVEPCTPGASGCPSCGNGRCEGGESTSNCPVDCTCRAECSFFTGYDRNEFACPEAFAACHCGDRVCQAWEAAGTYACPTDCGGR